MKSKDIGIMIIVIILLAQFISFLISWVQYRNILDNIKEDPTDIQNFVDFGNWIVEFLKAQIYGWPLSLIVSGIGYLLFKSRSRSPY